MNEFEDRLARSLQHEQQAPDEAFVARVSGAVGAEERARLLRLALATIAMLVLMFAFCYGLIIAVNASRVLSIASQGALTIATSVVCVFVLVLSLPLAFARE